MHKEGDRGIISGLSIFYANVKEKYLTALRKQHIMAVKEYCLTADAKTEGGIMALNDRQLRFTYEYMVDHNATQAAIRAGYSAKTAYSQGQRLLKKVEIRKVIGEATERQNCRIEITADRVLQEIAKIAFFDPRKLFDRYGNPKGINEIDDDTAAAIAGLDVDTKTDGESDLLTITKRIKIADKQKALDMLGRHYGLFDGKRPDGSEESGGGIVMLPDVMESDDDA